MTDPKSRVQLALELGDLLPYEKPTDPTTPGWGGIGADRVAEQLMQGGLSALSIALANVLLRLVDEQATRDERRPPCGNDIIPFEGKTTSCALKFGHSGECSDEQATVHPIAGGQVGAEMVFGPAEPLTTMPRERNQGLETRSAPVEPETTRGQLQAGLDDVANALGRPALLVGEHGEAVRQKLAEAQAELTRVKADNEDKLAAADRYIASLVAAKDDFEKRGAKAESKLTEAEQTITGLREELTAVIASRGIVAENELVTDLVNAARVLMRSVNDDSALVALDEALSALDALSQPEGATSSRSAPR